MSSRLFEVSIYVLLVMVLLSCTTEEEPNGKLVDSMPETKADYQKQIISQLSGESELADGSKIKSRWSSEERRKASFYLKDLLRQLNIEAKEQHYRAPNLNPAIDLLIGPFAGKNIYGVLKATTVSNEYIVLGAHYDSGKRGAPGADDNATGIALIYSVLKEVSKLENRAKNILIVFFDQEEEELIGSRQFADFLGEQSWDIHSIHCFDMVGWDDDSDGKMGAYSTSEDLISLYKSAAKNHDIIVEDRIVNPETHAESSTDFDAFVKPRYNVIGAGECFRCRDYSPFKDTKEDTYDKVDFEYLLSCSDLIEEVIIELL